MSTLQLEAPLPPIVKRPLLPSLFTQLGRRPIVTVEEAWREHGDLLLIQMGNFNMPIASHPALAQQIFIDRRDDFLKPGAAPRGDLLSLVLGNGLLTNYDNESWLSQRRMMQPIFHRRRLQKMAEKMTAAGERMVAGWQRFADGSTVDVHQEMTRVTLDIVTQTMFSSDVVAQAEQIGDAVETLLKFAFSRRHVVRVPLSWPTPANRRYHKAQRTLDGITYGIIDRRLQEEGDYDDLLSMLLAARDADSGKGMSREQLRDEVATIFGAGHETTSNALTWTLLLLAQNSEKRALLEAEVDQVLGDRSPTIDDLDQLPYTRQVFMEGLRLYPPAPFVPRFVPQQTTLDGHRIPGGSLLITSIWNIQRNPEIWEQPLRFEPARFEPQHIKRRHRLAFMPFGAGQRICIGNNFALIEGQLLLAMMAQHVRFDLVDGRPVEPQMAITLRPTGGLPMVMRRRKKAAGDGRRL